MNDPNWPNYFHPILTAEEFKTSILSDFSSTLHVVFVHQTYCEHSIAHFTQTTNFLPREFLNADVRWWATDAGIVATFLRKLYDYVNPEGEMLTCEGWGGPDFTPTYLLCREGQLLKQVDGNDTVMVREWLRWATGYYDSGPYEL